MHLTPNSGQSLDALFSAAYEHLRHLAASVSRSDPSVTLNPTALVNEAYLRLSASEKVDADTAVHFRRLAARAMRRILVDAARRRHASKRGGGHLRVTFDEEAIGNDVAPESLLALDAALEALEVLDERQARIVEYRFFGGYSVSETAELIGVSESTIHREWRVARSWLLRTVRREID
jgi:RNA polymerase sigma factor (TIGR02999 family)